QVVALTTNQAASLTSAQVAALTTAQVAALETTDVAVLATRQIAALTTAQVALGLTTAQVVALTTTQVAAIGTAQIGALTTTQVAVLETVDVAALTTAQVASLTTTQVASGFTTAQVVALTTTQAQALTTAQIGALTTAQVVALETRDLVALRTTQVRALTTSAMAALTTTQVAALTTTQVEALTSTQVGALSTVQIQFLQLGSPLILDLDGAGISTRSIRDGTRFDLFGDGTAVATGWVGAGDGLLVLDRDGNGRIDSGRELFGTATPDANGAPAADGFAALQAFDTNADGVIDASDPVWSQLRVWVDANADAISATGELLTLDQIGVARIGATARSVSEKDNGNWIGLRSTWQDTAGGTREIADVWFVAERNAPPPADPDSLGSRVGSLVQAMAAWNADADPAGAASLPTADAGGTAGALASGDPVGRMVDVLRQFDANGQPVDALSTLLQPAGPATSLTASLLPVGSTGGGMLTGDGR
nr:heme utilization protein [Burkholderiales bacterium]